MIGIMSEAILLEFALRLLGRNLVAYIVGSALATVAPIVQMVISLLITYGFDIARLYVALYDFAARSLHIQSFGPFDLVLLLVLINCILGGAAGVLGRSAGTRALALPPRGPLAPRPDSPFAPAEVGSSERFSLLFLSLHVVVIIGCFMAIGRLPLWGAAMLIALYLGVCLAYYRRVRRRFSKPRLWIEFGLISLLAGFLLGELTAATPGWSWSGLVTGMQMALRATLVVVGFTALSIELRNPVIISWLLRRGMGQLSASLEVAFQALPSMMAAFGEEKKFLRHPLESTARVLSSGIQWLDSFTTKQTDALRVHLVVGEQGEGKTTFLSSLVECARSNGTRIGGILAPVVFDHDRRIGYDIVNIDTTERLPLCRAGITPTGVTAGPFHFLSEGLALGKKALALNGGPRHDVLCIDEIGPLELRGDGWALPLDEAARSFQGHLILVVRSRLVNETLARWGLSPEHIWNVHAVTPAEAFRALAEVK
jgi:nucleoside-triphosphatase THEP1